MPLLSKAQKDALIQERKNLTAEEDALAAEASKIRKRREIIKERLEDIKTAYFQAFRAEASKARLEATSIPQYMETLRTLWNSIPKCQTYPKIKAFHWGKQELNDKIQMCSNTHRAPIGETTNWNRDIKKVTGFLGIQDELTIEFQEIDALNGRYVHPFETHYVTDEGPLGVNTGTGGSRNNTPEGNPQLGWDTTFFLQDFPKIVEQLKEWIPPYLNDPGVLIGLSLDTLCNLKTEDMPKYLNPPNTPLAKLCRLALKGES